MDFGKSRSFPVSVGDSPRRKRPRLNRFSSRHRRISLVDSFPRSGGARTEMARGFSSNIVPTFPARGGFKVAVEYPPPALNAGPPRPCAACLRPSSGRCGWKNRERLGRSGRRIHKALPSRPITVDKRPRWKTPITVITFHSEVGFRPGKTEIR